MLQRSSQVGEFYRMSPPAVYDTNTRLPKSYMDIMIYDEESDRHIHIPFRQAMYATTLGGTGGVTSDIFRLQDLTTADTDKFVRSLAARPYNSPPGTAVEAPAPPVALVGLPPATDANSLKTLGSALNGVGATEANAADYANMIIGLVEVGVWMPVEIVICRPFIEHLMMSAIVCVSGRDTGATLFGPADMCANPKTRARFFSQAFQNVT